MNSHNHKIDEWLRIKSNHFYDASDRAHKDSSHKYLGYTNRILGYFKGTYTDHYLNIMPRVQEKDVIAFRSFIPGEFDTNDTCVDKWNRNFVLPYDQRDITVPNLPKVVDTPNGGCMHPIFFNHNLKIEDEYKIKLVRFKKKISGPYYVPFISQTDGIRKGYIYDYYIKVSDEGKIVKFENDLNNYLARNKYNPLKKGGFFDLNIYGYEKHDILFDNDLHINYYNGINFRQANNSNILFSL